MEKCIEGAKKLIQQQVEWNEICFFGERFSKYQKAYYSTNENIREYLDLVDFDGKSNALSVLASGDQIFNLITKGIINIDTFDTNLLTEYFALGLKRAMILKYSYYEYIKLIQFICSNHVTIIELTEFIIGLFPYMDKKSIVFWRQIIEYNYKLQKQAGTDLNLMQMFYIETGFFKGVFYNNNYLYNEENYKLLRERLGHANITFKNANALNLSEEFHCQYDFILLSNILDYAFNEWGDKWTYTKLREYESQLNKIASSGAVIFLKYIFNYVSNYPIKDKLFQCSSISKKQLIDEEIYQLSKWDAKTSYSGIILKKL